MNLARASSLIAAGTLVSRMTGLVRTIVLVAAISSVGASADAFYVANQLPNTVLTLISTGLLTGVIVPRVVAVSAQADGGRIFLPKLITAGAAILLLTTAVALALAPALVAVMASGYDGATRDLTVAFAYWCLPQIFFYGMFALIGESLNARRMFTPYAWAPVVNNIVSIAGFGLFIALFGFHRTDVGWWTPSSIALVAERRRWASSHRRSSSRSRGAGPASRSVPTSAGAVWASAAWGASPPGRSAWSS